jgi:hypothetical protein
MEGMTCILSIRIFLNTIRKRCAHNKNPVPWNVLVLSKGLALPVERVLLMAHVVLGDFNLSDFSVLMRQIQLVSEQPARRAKKAGHDGVSGSVRSASNQYTGKESIMSYRHHGSKNQQPPTNVLATGRPRKSTIRPTVVHLQIESAKSIRNYL